MGGKTQNAWIGLSAVPLHQGGPIEDPMEAPQRPRPHAWQLYKCDN